MRSAVHVSFVDIISVISCRQMSMCSAVHVSFVDIISVISGR